MLTMATQPIGETNKDDGVSQMDCNGLCMNPNYQYEMDWNGPNLLLLSWCFPVGQKYTQLLLVKPIGCDHNLGRSIPFFQDIQDIRLLAVSQCNLHEKSIVSGNQAWPWNIQPFSGNFPISMPSSWDFPAMDDSGDSQFWL